MNNSQPDTRFRQRIWKRLSRVQLATLIMVGSLIVSGAIIAAWFAKQGTINQIFQTLNQLQENPPMWIEAPMMVGQSLNPSR